MPLNGLRWSCNSGSANCDMPQSAVFGQSGGGALGVTKVKSELNKATGIPTTKAGVERKIGGAIIKAIFGKK